MSLKKKPVNQWALAACTVAVAAAVGNPVQGADETQAIDQIQKYCSRSWQNAGIDRQDWSDCTQEALVSLMDRISRNRLATAIDRNESLERRELNRSVWRTIQRWRRRPRPTSLEPGSLPQPLHKSIVNSRTDSAVWDEVADLARCHLTTRQQRILDYTRDGWKTSEIADELKMTSSRVSDEKYKAIRKLQALI